MHMIFVDLEKCTTECQKILIYILWRALIKKKVGEEYIKVIQDMYDGCTTSVRTLLGSTERFEVKIGLHQGSTRLHSVLFCSVM